MFKKKKKQFDLKRTAHSAQQSPPVRGDRRYHPPRRMFGWRGGIQRRAARKQSLAVICLVAFLTLGAWGTVSAAANEPAPGNNWGIFSSIAELFGLAESKEETTPAEPEAAPNGSMQLSKEYIYAGSRMLAIEDYGISGTNSNPTPTPPTSGNTATFVRNDTTTQGNWIGAYGSQGHKVAGDGTSLPSWAQVSFNGQLDHVWAATTSDGRALKKVAGSGDRIASCWYTSGVAVGGTYNVSFNFTDGQEHQLAFYSLDWDGFNGRSQKLEVFDGASGSVLDTRNVTNFTNGVYTIWKVKGQVTIKVTNQQNNSNAVVGGFFIDAPNAPPPPTPTPTPATPTPTPATPTPTPAPKPDLVITNFTINPSQPNGGDQVNFSVTVTNQGAGAMNGFLGIKYQIDGACPAGGCPSHAVSSTTINPGQSVNLNGASSTWTATVGGHTLSAQVDDLGAIAESDESNNVANLSVNVAPPVPNIPANTYFQVVAQHSAKCADVSGVSYNDAAAIHQWGCGDANAANQLWKFERVGDEFQIIAQHSGKCMDVVGASTGDGADLQQYSCLGAGQTNQLWRVIEVGSNQYQIVAKHSGKCLDVPGADQNNGVVLKQYGCGAPGQTNQTWLLATPPPAPEPTPTPCNSSPGDIDICENVFGKRWNYETCNCENPYDAEPSAQNQDGTTGGFWQSLGALGLAW